MPTAMPPSAGKDVHHRARDIENFCNALEIVGESFVALLLADPSNRRPVAPPVAHGESGDRHDAADRRARPGTGGRQSARAASGQPPPAI